MSKETTIKGVKVEQGKTYTMSIQTGHEFNNPKVVVCEGIVDVLMPWKSSFHFKTKNGSMLVQYNHVLEIKQ